jgi:hypothetical protein
MMNDPFPFFEYLTQSQLGQLFGATSHKIGRWLKELGFKRPDNRPSDEAILSGMANNVTIDSVHFPVWNKEGVVTLLEANGHRRSDSTEPETPSHRNEVTLVGPFAARHNGGDGYEILDGNGDVGIWVIDTGRKYSRILRKLKRQDYFKEDSENLREPQPTFHNYDQEWYKSNEQRRTR